MAAVDRDPDAIRYILLRKLASGLRHRLLGDLQLIELTAELCSRMFQAGKDVAEIRVQLGNIQHQTGVAASNFRSIIEWLRPDTVAVARFGDTLHDCLRFAGDDWTLRGIEATVRMSDEASAAAVLCQAARELVVASLFALVDLHHTALDLFLEADSVGEHVVLSVEARTPTRVASLPPMPVYATLGWDDVQTLAKVHGVPCTCRPGRGAFSLRFSQHGRK